MRHSFLTCLRAAIRLNFRAQSAAFVASVSPTLQFQKRDYFITKNTEGSVPACVRSLKDKKINSFSAITCCLMSSVTGNVTKNDSAAEEPAVAMCPPECGSLAKTDAENNSERENDQTQCDGVKCEGTIAADFRDTAVEVNNLEEIKPPVPPQRSRSRKRKQPGLHMTFKRSRITSKETMSQTKYYFENGLRKVYPYDHKFNTFCKGRWIGKTLREIYSTEFKLYSAEFYNKAIKDGRLLVNLKSPSSLDQVLRSNDLLSSTVHRHECPVADVRIEVIEDNNDFFVINKPGSIPLHPGGRFRHNTVLSILAKEMRKTDLLSVHRLDRMTSGLLLFVKNKETATKVHSHIRERKVEKEYVSRVVGNFSKFVLTGSGHRIAVGEGDCPEIIINEAIKVYDYKVGVSVVSKDDDAKDCETIFKCLSTDGETSVVSCRPKTGRTHQIRVHLQYLGFPITNDPLYNSPAWGDERFKLGPITKPMEKVSQELSCLKRWLDIDDGMPEANGPQIENSANNSNEASCSGDTASEDIPEVVRRKGDIIIYRSSCEQCRHPLKDPEPEDLIMYLHALRYKGPDWEFETPLPKWAQPGWFGKREEKT